LKFQFYPIDYKALKFIGERGLTARKLKKKYEKTRVFYASSTHNDSSSTIKSIHLSPPSNNYYLALELGLQA